MLVEFKQKSQVTIPKELVRMLNIKVGDKFDVEIKDGKIVLTPVIIIHKDQEWFYTPEWQAKEKIVDQQIREGRIHTAYSKEELYKDLGLDDE